MKMDAGEHGRHLISALRIQLTVTGGDVLAAFLQDAHDIEGGAATHAHQQQLHRAWAQVFATVIRGPVQLNTVATATGGFEAGVAGPVDGCFHRSYPWCLVRMRFWRLRLNELAGC